MSPRISRWSFRLVWLCAVVAVVLLPLIGGFAGDLPAGEKSVLVLYGERGDLPAIEAVEENIRQVFHASTSPRIEVFSEYLDFTRFPAEQYERSLVRYLRERCAGRRIDLVVPVAGFALEFALGHREELFPGTPLVFCAIDQRELGKLRLPADATGITAHFDIERTVELILQLQPDVPEIVCVWRRKAEASLRKSEERMILAAKAANLGMWEWDLGNDDVWMTDKGRSILGIPPDEDVDYAALTERVHPEDRAAREAAIRRALKTRGEYAIEYRVVLPDGGVRWIGAWGHCVDGDNKATRLIGVSMDGKQVRCAVSLNDVIASVLRFVHSDALERCCVLVTELDPELPLVDGDQVQLQQVLLNLLVNAFEAMGETPLPKRRVVIRSERESGARVRVSVRDFGTGLSEKNPERIFERFFSTKHHGLGMGLAIARSIIASHEGELTATNVEGGGACVYFSLRANREGDV